MTRRTENMILISNKSIAGFIRTHVHPRGTLEGLFQCLDAPYSEWTFVPSKVDGDKELVTYKFSTSLIVPSPPIISGDEYVEYVINTIIPTDEGTTIFPFVREIKWVSLSGSTQVRFYRSNDIVRFIGSDPPIDGKDVLIAEAGWRAEIESLSVNSFKELLNLCLMRDLEGEDIKMMSALIRED